jgi:hypothetical protein
MAELETAQSSTPTPVERDILSSKERWFYSIPSFLFLLMTPCYPLFIFYKLDPVLAVTNWRTLPIDTQKALRLTLVFTRYPVITGGIGLFIVWLYFRWSSKSRARTYLFNLVLLCVLFVIGRQAYRGLNAAGLL